MTVQARDRSEHRGRRRVAAIVVTIAALGLCAFQFGDRNELNKMRFRLVQRLAVDLPKVRNLAAVHCREGRWCLFRMRAARSMWR